MKAPHAPTDSRAHGGQHPAGVHKEVFLDFLASKHLKLTRQRQAVVDLIFSDSGHFEAEALVDRLKIGRTRVSRATVYRTLELLRECQLVEKLDFGTPRSFYEHVPPGEHHDHLICTRCGNVIEFHNDQLEALQSEICSNFGFQDSYHSLRIFGLCSKCAQASG
jgi:Fur family transcriptional regulator, ferric uptake regulator